MRWALTEVRPDRGIAGLRQGVVLGADAEKLGPVLRAREQLDRHDVGVAVHHAAHHQRARERHESRRIDNQLRGRSGRQGDPGSSRFYLSLDDPLMRIFAGDRVKSIMERLKMPDGEAIEAGIVTRSIESAQC